MGKKRLKPIADVDNPAAVMAMHLREIYAGATDLTLTRLAARMRYSEASLSEALSGRTMPTLELITAFVRGCGREDALVEAGHVWRREMARSKGSTRPPHPDLVETWRDLHRELVLLAHQSGLFTPKALCDAAAAAGHPIKPTSAHRWLTEPKPMRSDSLNTILNACRVSMRLREPWVRAFDRAADPKRLPRQQSGEQSTGPPVATSGPDALFGDLRRLSRGRGVHAPDVDQQIGPALLQLCDLTDLDGPETVRQKVGDWVRTASQPLPHHLRLAVTTPLGLNPDAQFRFLQQRIDWLAAEQERSPGTCRRRIDEAMTRLVEAAFTPAGRSTTPVSREHTWHVREFEAVLNLDGDTPHCTENRTIVADRDGIDRITWSLTLPRHEDGTPANPHVKVLHGAQLLSEERPAPRRILLHLGLPRKLKAGEMHDFVLQVSVPVGQSMSPLYVFWPERRCERFRLVARFGEQAAPSAVWRVDHVFHRDADEIDTGRDYLPVNSVGEVQVAFADLLAGHGYGIRWER